MAVQKTKRRTRRPILESLERRNLLAADSCCAGQMPSDPPEAALDELRSEADNYFATDAGSTRGTAHDIGRLEGTRNLGGTVGRFDRSDVIRFSIESSADVSIGLSGMSVDLDVTLYDGNGARVAASDNSGRQSEQISRSLPVGTYYVEVAPWLWYQSSSYSLTLSAEEIVDEPAEPPVTPPTEPPVPPPADPPTPDPGLPATPFDDLPYWGGGNDWNLNSIGAPEAWAEGYGGDGVVVAVVDTGVDLDHPDLVSNLWVNAGEVAGNGLDDDGNGYVDDVHGWDFANRDNDPDDENGHGTHVSGTIAAAADQRGATGVAPNATVMPVQVLGARGGGSSFSVASGIRYAAENGADIINLSLGGGFSSAIRSAISYAGSLGALVVAAAGNDSASTPGYPARHSGSFDHVISVGAHTSSDNIAGFSNGVGDSGAVQVDAPGAGIYSTYVGGGYARLSGTSMASPHVAGLAALTLSANPDLTPSQMRSLIVGGSHRSINGSDSQGGVDAAHTVAFAAAGLTAVGVPQTPSEVSSSDGLVSVQWVRITSFSGASSASDLTSNPESLSPENQPEPESIALWQPTGSSRFEGGAARAVSSACEDDRCKEVQMSEVDQVMSLLDELLS